MEKIIEDLVKLGARQGKNADKACEYLLSLFERNTIAYSIETYLVDIPVWGVSTLKADGRMIANIPTGLTSGVIRGVSALTSSLISSRIFLDIPHINFNPKSKIVSRANFSFAPSCAVSRDSLPELYSAQKVEGRIRVQKKQQTMRQILIGNRKNPKNIIFSHFDSVGTGAVDNASGTALMTEFIVRNKDLLEENLFVFDGNEEISFDYPTYWGKGYRNFEKRYSKQTLSAQKLIVVDCIGYEKTQVLQGESASHIISLAFPIKNVKKLSSKIKLITSDYDKLMEVYHSDLDNGGNIKEKYLKEASRILQKMLR